jgi:hypothetical protein
LKDEFTRYTEKMLESYYAMFESLESNGAE